MKSGRSLASEVEMRLENSFSEEDRLQVELKSNLVVKALFGDAETEDLIRAMTAAIGAALAYTGQHWTTDPYSRAAVRAAIQGVYRRQFQARPLPGDAGELDLDRLDRAEKAGDLYGKLLVAPQADPDIAAFLSGLLTGKRPQADDEADTVAFGKMSKKQKDTHLRELYGTDAETLNSLDID